MKNKSGEVIYIGKAKALKNRVTQYFGSGSGHSEKVKKMVSNVDSFEYVICDSEFEALVLECSLIKQYQPRYNILLKDDKGYHYIRVTDGKWPKLEFANTTEKSGEYIGPYYSAYVASNTLDEVRRIFKLPDCGRSFDKPSKPCLNYHIGRCDAPCRGRISNENYLEALREAKNYIKNGNASDIISELTEKMQAASKRLDFEYAAKLRDRIKALHSMKQQQKVVMCTYKEQDVFACAFVGEQACVSILNFRNYRLSDKKHYFTDGTSDRNSLYPEFLPRYYSDVGDIPARVLLDESFEGAELIGEWLAKTSGKKVSVIVPKAGEQKSIVSMCLKNAADNLSQKTERSGKEMSALNELSKLLGLQSVPRYIEAYDISHTDGDQNVGAMVVFKDGRPLKSAYKRFKIKGFTGQDDYRSMAEVIDRRLTEFETGSDNGFKSLPDLILLDGGSGQVSAAEPVLRSHSISVPIFGMVKDSKHRTRAISSSGGDIQIKANRSAYTLVTMIQDEVHRFAVGYHRKLRSRKMLSSDLTKIPGIGEKRARLLLKHFKTLKAVKQASEESLCAVQGISKSAAAQIYSYFHPENK